MPRTTRTVARSRRVRGRTGAYVAALATASLAACTSTGPASQPSGGDVSEVAASPSTGAPTTDAGPTTEATLTPVTASVLDPPVPFEGSGGRTHLVYELVVTNFSAADATVDGLDVLDSADDETIAHLGTRAVRSRLQPAGERDSAGTLGSSQSATLFVHVTLDPGEAVPEALGHVLTVTADAAPPDLNPIAERIAPTRVDERTIPVLAPPLSGGRFVAADGCCDAVRHTRAILPINGELFVAQRYAIDYEKIDEGDRIYVGEREDPASYAIFGAKVFAVADGTVVGAIDDLPEQTPGTFPENIPLSEADGNSVVLDLGGGFFANYAHMQPGSLRVQVGDRVSRGDVLGLVGNSGNSVAPHLHFHVMDGPSPLAAQGLPYLVDSFTVWGRSKSTEAFDKAEAEGTPLPIVDADGGRDHGDQLVLDQRIVGFSQPRGR